MSERSRCAFLRIVICRRAPSAGIVCVGALPLCVFAHFDVRPRTLCGDRACRSAPAVRFCAFYNLLRTPSAGIVRVGALPLCVLRILQLASHTLCGERACRSARAVRFCAYYNLLRTPSAGIVRVGALPLCVFAYFEAWSRTLCGDRACRSLPHLFLSSWRMPGAASTFCSTNVVRRGRPKLP